MPRVRNVVVSMRRTVASSSKEPIQTTIGRGSAYRHG
jgi:hypothetical protein